MFNAHKLKADIYCFISGDPGAAFSKKEFRAFGAVPVEGFTVTCHSGALGTRHNTLGSVKTALAWGAQIIEIDVSFRPDGEAVIIHNAKPSQRQGVSLERVLEAVSRDPNCRLNLDLKAFWNVKEVDRLAEKYGLMNRVFYTGVSGEEVRQVAADSKIPYFLNAFPELKKLDNEQYARGLAEKIKALGAVGLNCQYKHISRKIIDVLHEYGLEVSVWTVNRLSEQCEMLALGADNITTLKPEALRRYIKSIK